MEKTIQTIITKREKQDAHRDSCHKLGFTGSILGELSAEITKSGFAGSTQIPELVYLVLMTGMLEKPVSLIIKGTSGAGKSFSLNAGKQFIPKPAYEQFEGMSEKALVYLKGLDLKHKHLVIGEAAGMAEGNGRALLRQLLSEGSVTYATVQSTDKDGLTGSTLPTLEGPCGLLMTTTANTLHAEDESRMLSISINESPDQIREALLAQAIGATKKTKAIDTARWHELYHLIQNGPKEVSIPFAKDIVMQLPTSHDRIKRDFPQLLSLISAHALMHSFDREWLDENTVVATQDDYQNVHRLVNEAMSQGLEATVSGGLRELVDATEELAVGSESHFGISQTKLAEHLGRDQSVISRNVKRAVKAGYLEDKNPGQGKVAKLIIGERKLPNQEVLPCPDKLFAESITKAADNDDRGIARKAIVSHS